MSIRCWRKTLYHGLLFEAMSWEKFQLRIILRRLYLIATNKRLLLTNPNVQIDFIPNNIEVSNKVVCIL
jgi:hypothetical protein